MNLLISLKSESRRKKVQSPKARARSEMLKAIMPELSGEIGEELAKAIKNRNGGAAERILTQIAKSVGKKISRKATS